MRLKKGLQRFFTRQNRHSWRAYSDSIQALTDEEIILKSTKGWGWIRRIFDFKNDAPRYIPGFSSNLNFRKKERDWCGPWALNWIYNSHYGGDRYDYFKAFAGTIGLGGLNFVFSTATNTKPMFPSEMNLAMKFCGMWVDPIFYFGQWDAYYHIRDANRPICIALVTGGQGHWIVAYGTKTTGTYAWRNYFYAISDNGTLTSNTECWWQAPWFIAYVRVYHA